MNRQLALSVAVCFALAASVSNAHAQRRASLSVAGGAAMPTGDFGKAVGTGFNLTAAIHVTGTPSVPIGFRIDGMWNQFGENDDNNVESRVLSLNGNLVLSFSNTSTVTPYLIGGVGMYNTKFELEGDDDDDDDSESETDLGLNGGFGIRFGLSGLSTFAELRLHNVFTEGDSDLRFIPITFGILF